MLVLLSLFTLVACSSKKAYVISAKSYTEKDGTKVIELPNPFQQNIFEEMNTKITPHTVYDDPNTIEAYKKSKNSKIIERITTDKKSNRLPASTEQK